MYEIVDLSQEIYTGAPRFPGHPATEIEYVARHEDAANAPIKPKDITYAAMMLHMCDHGPTHTDSVSHIDERETAPNIDQAPLEWFITRAVALDFTGKVEPMEEISLQLLQDELSAAELAPPKTARSSSRAVISSAPIRRMNISTRTRVWATTPRTSSIASAAW